MRQSAVEILSTTALVGTALAVATSAQDSREYPGMLLLALALSFVMGIVVFVLASRAIEHRNPDWRRFFERAHYDELYELVAAIAMVVLWLSVGGLLALLTKPTSPLLPMLGGAYVGNVARSLILAGGRATQRS
jgi:phosphotransferase system  glucose/maltose/N-acetylglucosamine-specific IIC component